jgi:hypothetical protein
MSGKLPKHSKQAVLSDAQGAVGNRDKLDQTVDPTLLDYYRMPRNSFPLQQAAADCTSGKSGFFQFGEGIVCFGRSESGTAEDVAGSAKFPVSMQVGRNGNSTRLPFSFAEVIENLRLEHYRRNAFHGWESLAANQPIHKLYYLSRGCFPTAVRRQLQRIYFRDWKKLQFPNWPVDFTVDKLHEEYLRLLMEANGLQKVPFIWFWPDGAANCLIMTHDVETLAGRNFTSNLMNLDESYGFKSSFEVIPEDRYEVPDSYVHEIRQRGFEFNVHDLNHDGSLYRERQEFLRRAAKINGYVRRYNARGFRAGSMYRNQDWYDAFEFSYDMSVPNVAHLDPMRGGCCTVMPYFVGRILELPAVTTQDYSLFHILSDYSIDIWKQQLVLIRERNGLMSFITHPDYLIERRARKVYESLLDYLRQMIERDGVWTALPGEVDSWWRARSQMQLVPQGDDWKIVGPGHEKARVAYAIRERGPLVYELA